jgi:predicted RNase H-like nuclease (RuvC/YqgF family)
MKKEAVIICILCVGVGGFLGGLLLGGVINRPTEKRHKTEIQTLQKTYQDTISQNEKQLSNLQNQYSDKMREVITLQSDLEKSQQEISDFKGQLEQSSKELLSANAEIARFEKDRKNQLNWKPQSSSSTKSEYNNDSIKPQTPIYNMGQDVRVADVSWKVREARNRGSVLTSAYDLKTTTGKFIQIFVEVENLSKGMKTATNLTLVDNKGREYAPASDVSEWIPQKYELFLISNLNPNVPVVFSDIYEVPEDATGLMVKVGDLSLVGQKEALISLNVD